jgi:exopolyphosphatase / guanosine-5'-triphosphate,3'-diphosphate pyrophosphatase
MPTFAAIDIGSNSVRLKISRLQAGRLKEIHEDREVTRLGEGVFSSGLLSPESMSQTVQVLRRFNRAVQECGTDSVKVVATAALRDARNSRIFLEWVRVDDGMDHRNYFRAGRSTPHSPGHSCLRTHGRP